MSQLFHTETGRTLGSFNEEVTRWRWVRKTLDLPAAAAAGTTPATFWLFAYSYANNPHPLEVHLNGRKLGEIAPVTNLADCWHWLSIDVPAGRLRAGRNEFTLRRDSPAMNAWAIGLEPGPASAGSALSFDQGRTWQHQNLGAHGVLAGEYMLRLRVEAPGLADPALPSITYEDAGHPRVRELRDALPAAIRDQADPWRQVLELRSWVCSRWTYHGGHHYTPWDPLTILDWGKHDRGHGQGSAVAFCVHYGSAFAAFAAALGHRARCVAITGNLTIHAGHFLAEVWSEALGQWVLHDPTIDAHWEAGRPLSLLDLADLAHAGRMAEVTAHSGPARPSTPALANALAIFATGASLDLVSVWARNDYVSNPLASPPSHGWVVYAETDFVWYVPAGRPAGLRGADMFPCRTAERAWFDAAPPAVRISQHQVPEPASVR